MAFLSKRLEGLAQSDIRRMSRECNRVGGINLGQGLCDMPTPTPVAEGAKAAIDARASTYTYPEGTAELRELIAAKLARENGIRAAAEGEITVTIGATGAFAATLTALLDAGDGILLLEPYYGYHLNTALVAGLEPHYATLEPPNFEVRQEALRAALKPNTRAIVVCTPQNPSGKMLTQTEIEALARVASERDLLVITDEIYEYIRYDGRPHISPASHADLAERTVTIMGLSKTFSITGWRMGYAVAPEPLSRAITLVNDLYYVCAPAPLQRGVADGFRMPSSFFESLQTDYQRKRDILCDALRDARLDPIVPEGAYYVLADASALGQPTSAEAAMSLLHKTHVASVPGSAFYRGAPGDRLLRFCFAKEDHELEEAARRLRQAA